MSLHTLTLKPLDLTKWTKGYVAELENSSKEMRGKKWPVFGKQPQEVMQVDREFSPAPRFHLHKDSLCVHQHNGYLPPCARYHCCQMATALSLGNQRTRSLRAAGLKREVKESSWCSVHQQISNVHPLCTHSSLHKIAFIWEGTHQHPKIFQSPWWLLVQTLALFCDKNTLAV